MGGGGWSANNILPTMLLHFMIPCNLICKLNFDLLTPYPRVVWGGVCRQHICYHVAALRDCLKFNIQHDHGPKKLNFDLLTRSWGGVCGQYIGYHVAVFRDSL